ncbi:hypothetical protein C9374_005506 [Naegleria lovaniensis]|uniref:RNase III domain-containing protein n=1 Tax=Naegleria lovaniensis TaxID=51637 RepID=A0AA88GJU6_NAELO|nr:uncharacterized protein C9374_005506 [Naegleria lovaniensis]KAG2382304.1 hypothetical protein C9374_005506 [Naegleria lovaniensis]
MFNPTRPSLSENLEKNHDRMVNHSVYHDHGAINESRSSFGISGNNDPSLHCSDHHQAKSLQSTTITVPNSLTNPYSSFSMFVTVYEFIFRENIFTTVTNSSMNETTKDYIYQQKSTHGWLEYSKQTSGFLQSRSEKVRLLASSSHDEYTLEKFLLLHFTNEKPTAHQMLSRKIPEFIAASFCSFHVSCRLNKLGVFEMDFEAWCQLQEIKSCLASGRVTPNLKRNDLMLYPFISMKKSKGGFKNTSQASLFKTILNVETVREIVTKESNLNLQTQLVAQEKILEKLESHLDHYDQLHTSIEHALNISFSQDPVLLRMAFTLSSYAHAYTLKRNSNERLEFMGDAVVNLACMTYLIRTFRNDSSKAGDWVAANMILIGNDNITRVATETLNIPPLLLKNSEGVGKKTLSDVFEAIIGGYFLSHGLEKARHFAEQMLIPTNFENEKILRTFESWIPDVCENGKAWTRDKPYSNLVDLNFLQQVQNIIGYKFKNIELLQEALLHYSFNETCIVLSSCPKQKVSDFMRKRGMKNNTNVAVPHLYNSEQMKLLGTTLLKFLAAEYVYKRFTEAQPKSLTLVLHRMVGKNDVVFQKIFTRFRLDRFSVRRAPIEDASELAYEVFLCILGAMYIDNNYQLFKHDLNKDRLSQQHWEELEKSTDLASVHFLSRHDISVDKFFERTVIEVVEEYGLSPYNIQVPKKSDLQHRIQLIYKVPPTYSANTVEIDGMKLFTCSIQVPGENQMIELAKSCSRNSKEEAESMAIDLALKNLTIPASPKEQ